MQANGLHYDRSFLMFYVRSYGDSVLCSEGCQSLADLH